MSAVERIRQYQTLRQAFVKLIEQHIADIKQAETAIHLSHIYQQAKQALADYYDTVVSQFISLRADFPSLEPLQQGAAQVLRALNETAKIRLDSACQQRVATMFHRRDVKCACDALINDMQQFPADVIDEQARFQRQRWREYSGDIQARYHELAQLRLLVGDFQLDTSDGLDAGSHFIWMGLDMAYRQWKAAHDRVDEDIQEQLCVFHELINQAKCDTRLAYSGEAGQAVSANTQNVSEMKQTESNSTVSVEVVRERALSQIHAHAQSLKERLGPTLVGKKRPQHWFSSQSTTFIDFAGALVDAIQARAEAKLSRIHQGLAETLAKPEDYQLVYKPDLRFASLCREVDEYLVDLMDFRYETAMQVLKRLTRQVLPRADDLPKEMSFAERLEMQPKLELQVKQRCWQSIVEDEAIMSRYQALRRRLKEIKRRLHPDSQMYRVLFPAYQEDPRTWERPTPYSRWRKEYMSGIFNYLDKFTKPVLEGFFKLPSGAALPTAQDFDDSAVFHSQLCDSDSRENGERFTLAMNIEHRFNALCYDWVSQEQALLAYHQQAKREYRRRLREMPAEFAKAREAEIIKGILSAPARREIREMEKQNEELRIERDRLRSRVKELEEASQTRKRAQQLEMKKNQLPSNSVNPEKPQPSSLTPEVIHVLPTSSLLFGSNSHVLSDHATKEKVVTESSVTKSNTTPTQRSPESTLSLAATFPKEESTLITTQYSLFGAQIVERMCFIDPDVSDESALRCS